MCALVAAAPQEVSRSRGGGFRLPLSLYLSPQIPEERAARLRELARLQPGIAHIAASEDGALHVLPRFDPEELSSLERRRGLVIGLPFAERIFRDPRALLKVHALPLFDLLLPESQSVVCCSGLEQAPRTRCATLARWMGGRFSEDLGEAGLLVTTRVSLLPDSKYQAALQVARQRELHIVRPTYLEAMWASQAEVAIAPYVLPALCGLKLCLGGSKGLALEELRRAAAAEGAEDRLLDQAEVVIVKDVFDPLYDDARRIGKLAAPPLWLETCLRLRRCVPIAGELQVQNPRAVPLRGAGGDGAALPGAMPGASSSCMALVQASTSDGHPLGGAPGAEQQQQQQPAPTPQQLRSGLALCECVICLLYLPSKELQDAAKAMAWKCGAWTTVCPFDRRITHVLFQVDPLDQSTAQVSVEVDEDQTSFVDISWLEACAREGKRVSEALYPQRKVFCDPARDPVSAALAQRAGGGGAGAGAKRAKRPQGLSPRLHKMSPRSSKRKCLEAGVGAPPPLVAPDHVEATGAAFAPAAAAATAVEAPPPAPAPPAAAAPQPALQAPPTSAAGVFAGHVLGLLGWQAGDPEAADLVAKICGQGGTAVYGGGVQEVLAGSVTTCVCRGFGAPHLPVARRPVQLATVYWLEACIADGVFHPPTSFPHFQPGTGPMPLPDMQGCCTRITALGASASADNQRRRRRIEELVQVLGARAAQHSTRWAELTHVVCVAPELLDRRMYEAASRKGVAVVNLQWLFDCFTLRARQPVERYSVTGLLSKLDSQAAAVDATPPTLQNFAADLLAGYEVVLSPSALGSDPRLPQMAEELGGQVLTWRTAAELGSLLEARGLLTEPGEAEAATTSSSSGPPCRCVVLLEGGELAHEGGGVAACLARVPPSRRGAFVAPTWLAETFQQRRRLPLEAFAALPEEAAAKPRPATTLGEAIFGWQPAAQTTLEELAEDSKARALQLAAARKVNEGLRLAELRGREPSRSGA